MIDIYRSDALMNGLKYDSHMEEKAVELFALNIMKAVTIIDNAPLIASKAGNDMLLMPIDETEVIDSILNEMQTDPAYREQVYQSVKKIIRLKIFMGLIK